MKLDANAKLELATKHLERFSVEFGQHCAGLRLVALHLPAASFPPDSRDSRYLLDLLLEGLNELHTHMEEELSFLLQTNEER